MRQYIHRIQVYLYILSLPFLAISCVDDGGNNDDYNTIRTLEEEQAEADDKFVNAVEPKYIDLRGMLYTPLSEEIPSFMKVLPGYKWYAEQSNINYYKGELQKMVKAVKEIKDTKVAKSPKRIKVIGEMAAILYNIEAIKKIVDEQGPAGDISPDIKDSIKTHIQLLGKRIENVDEALSGILYCY